MSDDLYHETILRLAGEAAAMAPLDGPHGSARVDNPLCGDRVDAQVRLDGASIEAASFKVRGCRLCEASAVLVARTVAGMPRDRWPNLADAFEAMVRTGAAAPADWPGSEVFAPVHGFKSRHDCPLLPLEALGQAIEQAVEEAGSD